MGKWIAVTALGLILAGCQFVGRGPDTGPPVVEEIGEPSGRGRVERQVPFPEEEYAKLEKRGTSTITGQLFIETSNGIVYGANEAVSAAPATTYSAEAAEAALAGKQLEPADPRAKEYTHYAKTDSRGYFKLTNLPAGVFYVGGRVSVPGGERRAIINQVRLDKGETVEVTLSR